MSKIRIATFGLAAVVVLAWAVPALAGNNKSAAVVDKVTVTAGKPTPFGYIVAPKVVSKGFVTFKITNKGQGIPHDFKIAGKASKTLQPGKSDTLRVRFAKAGKYAYVCTVPGHAAAGMKGTLVVK